MAATKAYFTGEADFCPRCGAILPLPGQGDIILCKGCQYSVDLKAFHGAVIYTEYNFNKRVDSSAKTMDSSASSGPTLDRKCGRCGNDKMTYKTQQTRSADEGQTVFYCCTECGFQEIEYS